jgi:hypothetical protein
MTLALENSVEEIHRRQCRRITEDGSYRVFNGRAGEAPGLRVENWRD